MKKIVSVIICIGVILAMGGVCAQERLPVYLGDTEDGKLYLQDGEEVEIVIHEDKSAVLGMAWIKDRVQEFDDSQQTLEEVLSALFVMNVLQMGHASEYTQDVKVDEIIESIRVYGFDFSIVEGIYPTFGQNSIMSGLYNNMPNEGEIGKTWQLNFSPAVSITLYVPLHETPVGFHEVNRIELHVASPDDPMNYLISLAIDL